MSFIPITINMEADWRCKVRVNPADDQVNALFRVASSAILGPHRLAMSLGRLSEERCEVLLAKTYAQACMVDGTECHEFTPDQWEEWLLADRERFAVIRSICESPRNFDPDRGRRNDHDGDSYA